MILLGSFLFMEYILLLSYQSIITRLHRSCVNSSSLIAYFTSGSFFNNRCLSTVQWTQKEAMEGLPELNLRRSGVCCLERGQSWQNELLCRAWFRLRVLSSWRELEHGLYDWLTNAIQLRSKCQINLGSEDSAKELDCSPSDCGEPWRFIKYGTDVICCAFFEVYSSRSSKRE